jgi:hypothetical protein
MQSTRDNIARAWVRAGANVTNNGFHRILRSEI